MFSPKNLDKFYIDDFVKDIFLGVLQQLLYENDSEFHWDPEEGNSRIKITDQFSYDTLTPEFKPTIYIRRRPLGFMNTSIDQFQGRSFQGNYKTYTDLLSGVAELVAVSREGLEACRLGSIIFLLMNQFTDVFRKLGMHDVSVKTLGEEEPKDIRATFKVVEVPVTVQYVFQYSWMVTAMDNSGIRVATDGTIVSPKYKTFNGIEVGRSSDAVTGVPLTGAVKGNCGKGDGAAMKDPNCPDCVQTDSSGKVKICIPMTSDNPTT